MLAVLIMLLLVVLLLVNAAGVVLVMLQLPGTWLIVVATAAMALWPATEIGWLWVAVLLALAGVGELIEFLASAHGARKAGATRRAAVGSLIGGVVGAIVCTFLIPIIVVGTLIGACAGAGIGSYLGDVHAGRTSAEAIEGGRGAAIGRLWGTIGKVIIAVAMWLITLAAVILAFIPD